MTMNVGTFGVYLLVMHYLLFSFLGTEFLSAATLAKRRHIILVSCMTGGFLSISLISYGFFKLFSPSFYWFLSFIVIFMATGLTWFLLKFFGEPMHRGEQEFFLSYPLALNSLWLTGLYGSADVNWGLGDVLGFGLMPGLSFGLAIPLTVSLKQKFLLNSGAMGLKGHSLVVATAGLLLLVLWFITL
jgi:hypothetical protein